MDINSFWKTIQSNNQKPLINLIQKKKSYLEYELYPSLKSNVLLVQPGTVQLIKSTEDEHLPIFFGEMNFVIFFFFLCKINLKKKLKKNNKK